MKKEDNIENITVRRSTRNKTNVPVDSLVKLEEEEEKTRLKRRLRFQATEESSHLEGVQSVVSDSSNFDEQPQEPVENDNSLHCKTCNYTYSSSEVYLSHQRQIHSDELPQNYCNFCDKHFKTTTNYRYHMKSFHVNGILRYNYCNLCKKQYKNRETYRAHMERIHDIKVPTHREANFNPDKVPDQHDPNFYCNVCDRTFSSLATYRYHLKTIHQIAILCVQKPKILYPDKVPDKHNLNNFCDPCQYTYKTVNSFRKHLKNTHNIAFLSYRFQSIIKNTSIQPKIDLKSYYCNACVHKFRSKRSYRNHMLRIHDIELKNPLKRKRNDSSLTPDINDKNNYCCACDHKYKSKSNYREHLLAIHSIKYNNSFIDPELIPNIDDPSNHCSVCKKSYSCRSSFRKHLFNCHPNTRPLMTKMYKNYITKIKKISENGGIISIAQKEEIKVADSILPH